MAQSFGIVEEKIFEAEFFLEKIKDSSSINFESKFYFSAFVSATRSITFSLQATLKKCDDFTDWYKVEQDKLKTDALAPLFIDIRNEIIHKGNNILNQVSAEHLHNHLTNQLNGNSKSNVIVLPLDGGSVLVDAVPICGDYFSSLVELVYYCYEKFKYIIDPQWYFTQDNFKKNGRCIKDALAEMGYPEAWYNAMLDENDAWKLLRRQQQSCVLNELFFKYIGKTVFNPDENCTNE